MDIKKRFMISFCLIAVLLSSCKSSPKDIQPVDASACFSQGMAYLEQEKYDQAISEFNKAIDIYTAAKPEEDNLRDYIELIVGFKDEDKLLKTDIKSDIELTVDIIKRRLYSFGFLKGPVTIHDNNQIRIRLPIMGTDKISKIREIITNEGKLEFKLEAKRTICDAYMKHRPDAPDGYQWYEFIRKNKSDESEWILLENIPVITSSNIIHADYEFVDPMEGLVIAIKMDGIGKAAFADVTGKHSERTSDPRRIAILWDDKVFSAPAIKSKITGGEAIITGGMGGFIEEEARRIVKILRSGTLPALLEIRKESERNIVKLYFKRGVAYYKKGDFKQAKADLTKVFDLNHYYKQAEDLLKEIELKEKE